MTSLPPGFVLVLWALVATARADASGAAPELELVWEVLPGEPGAPTSALALDSSAKRLALGSERGGRVVGLGGEPHISVDQPGVLDLAFYDAGLVLGTQDGLFEVAPDGSTSRASLGAGAREVRDVCAVGEVAAAATAGGLYLRVAGAPWARVPLPSGAAERVVLLAEAGVVRVAAWGAGGLWSFPLATPLRPVRRSPPRLAGGAAPVFLTPGPETALLLVYPDALALERPDEGWEVWRPTLPPGASLRGHAYAFSRHWLASDAGLLVAERLEGPWRRASGPLGGRSIVTLVGEGDALFIASKREVYAAYPVAQAPLPPLPDGRPPVEAVQRAALRHQSLEARDTRELRRGLGLRGFLPELSLAGSYERSRSRGGDYDESVVSGATRRLHDRDYDRDRDLHVAVTLRWDLGDLAYHPESIDVSREARALVALRDDVLDEVNQLYFDRLRALAQLALLSARALERPALETRVAELRAGLDAWTGGWFGRALQEPIPGPATPGRKHK